MTRKDRPRWAANYDEVAESFAYFTGLATTPIANAMVRLARLSLEDRVLDVGTGTGIVALSAATQVSQPGMVTGIDLAAGQLAIAKRKIDEAGVGDRVGLLLGDAENLPFGDGEFDSILSLFAVFHFPHPELALAEFRRVLKPGGRLVIGVGSGPAWNMLRGWRHRLRHLAALIRLKSGKALLAPAHLERLVSRHLVSSPVAKVEGLGREFRRRGKSMAELVRHAGFGDVQTDWEGSSLTLPDPAQFWDLQRTFSSPARTRLSAASPAEVERVRNLFLAECGRVQMRGGTLEYHSGALLVSGVSSAEIRRRHHGDNGSGLRIERR